MMSVVQLEMRPKRVDSVLVQEAPDSETLLLLDPEGGEYFTLDAVGRRVWSLIDGTRSAADIATVVADEYDAPSDVIARDVLELLEELAAAGLVTR